jgi:hypothetical protein
MRNIIARILVLGVVAALMVGVAAGCGLFGGDEPEVVDEPTPDLAQTIAAAVQLAIPTATPTPEPTATPTPTVPPTPDVPATVAAMLAAQLALMQPTAVPAPVPVNTPVPAAPTASPTQAPTPQTVTNPVSGPPAFIIGSVTINGLAARDGEIIYGRPKNTDLPRIQDQTDENGNYQLNSTQIGAVYDLWVGGIDSGVDTDPTTRGGLQRKNLSVNR